MMMIMMMMVIMMVLLNVVAIAVVVLAVDFAAATAAAAAADMTVVVDDGWFTMQAFQQIDFIRIGVMVMKIFIWMLVVNVMLLNLFSLLFKLLRHIGKM